MGYQANKTVAKKLDVKAPTLRENDVGENIFPLIIFYFILFSFYFFREGRGRNWRASGTAF